MSTSIFYNKTINKKELKSIIQSTFQSYGIVKTTKLTEGLKKSGFAFATQAGISISIEDLKVPPSKDTLFAKNETSIKLAYYYEKRGNINEIERFQKVIDTWHTTSEMLKNQLVDYFKTLDPLNPVYMMAFSGARGNLSQVRQLVGMRGLMADPNGQIIDLPIKTNFREGLTITDYVISSYGARKGIVDTALRTADSGYLTRRLVDVAQHVIIRELDCQTKNGVRLFYDPKHSKIEQYLGRVLAKAVYIPNSQKILLEKNIVLTKENLNSITVPVNLILRSPLICESSRSICQKCYGWNLSQGQLVELADAIGIIAAQSIGEPGTQLTMRTFHTGGVFTGESNNQIRSVLDGQILFSSSLKTEISRTLYGEIILKANNISELFIFNKLQKTLNRICIPPDTLIFVPNKSFVKNGDLIAESPLLNKRTTTRVKNIFSEVAGEVQFQNIPANQQTKLSKNGLIWIASGQIYDILPNMLIKSAGTSIVKHAALAQTKITSRVSGMLKCTNVSTVVPNYLVNCSLLGRTCDVKKTEHGELFVVGKNNESYLLEPGLFKKTKRFKRFAQKQTKNYSVSTAHKLYYSRIKLSQKGQLESLGLCILEPKNLVTNSKTLKPQAQAIGITHLVQNTLSNKKLDKKILFPGEILNETIEISKLSYCQIAKTNNNALYLTISPLKQVIIPKSIQHGHVPSFGRDFQTCKIVKSNLITYKNNSHLESGSKFIETSFEFSKNLHSLTNQLVFKICRFSNNNQKRFGLFQLFKVPTNFIGIAKNKINVTYLTKVNQYIQPYTVLATLNSLPAKKVGIKNLKNSKNNPNRFLISTASDYKSYKKERNYETIGSKFIAIGDKIGKSKVTNYSGYQLETSTVDQLQIRVASPFFVSPGTRIFAQHGSLIQEDESLFQFIYTRVISSDIVTGLPRIEQLLEGRIAKNPCRLIERPGVIKKRHNDTLSVLEKCEVRVYDIDESMTLLVNKGALVEVAQPLDGRLVNPHEVLEIYFKYYCSLYAFESAAKRSVMNIQILLVNLIQGVYKDQGIYISNKHVEVIVRQITSKVKISELKTETGFEVGEFLEFEQARYINMALKSTKKTMIEYQPILLGITKVSLMTESFISAASFQETTRVLTKAAVEGKVEWLRGLKENVILGRLVPAGTGFKSFNSLDLLNVRLS
jgi:DNA-directed RNA polymerase subunit beta'